jgi:prolyl oligopeptidase PreP (S9A serine peptidase family)
MRPDLFAAVSCVSPVTDLKRADVLGCPDPWKAAAVDFNGENSTTLFSPFHNLDKSVKKYPPILFTTVENASVVHPGHSRKMVKRLWNEGLGKKWPTFYFESVSSPQTSVQEQYAFITALAYDFLFKKASKST